MKNYTVPNAKNWPAEKKRPKKGGIRLIDKGTVYDAAGAIQRHARKVMRGDYGRVTDVTMAIRSVKKDGRTAIQTMYCGISQVEVLHYMATRLAGDIAG